MNLRCARKINYNKKFIQLFFIIFAVVRVFLILGLVLSYFGTKAQNKVTLHVKSSNDGDDVVYAKVMHAGKSYLTNNDGFVSLPYITEELVTITHLSFDTLEVDLNTLTPNMVHLIYMKPFIYQLKEVTFSLLGPRYSFDSRFAKMKPAEDLSGDLKKKLNLAEMKDELGILDRSSANGVRLGSPITALYDMFSKSGKEKRKYNELMARKWSEDLLFQKFNDKVVHQLTLYEGQKLYDFIDFMSISKDYVNRVSLVEIYTEILYCRDEFEKLGY